MCASSVVKGIGGAIREGSATSLLTAFQFYLLLLSLPVSLVLQLGYLNSALAQMDSLEIVPPYQASVIIIGLLWGWVFTGDATGASSDAMGMFALGCLISCAGVGLLAFKRRAVPAMDAWMVARGWLSAMPKHTVLTTPSGATSQKSVGSDSGGEGAVGPFPAGDRQVTAASDGSVELARVRSTDSMPPPRSGMDGRAPPLEVELTDRGARAARMSGGVGAAPAGGWQPSPAYTPATVMSTIRDGGAEGFAPDAPQRGGAPPGRAANRASVLAPVPEGRSTHGDHDHTAAMPPGTPLVGRAAGAGASASRIIARPSRAGSLLDIMREVFVMPTPTGGGEGEGEEEEGGPDVADVPPLPPLVGADGRVYADATGFRMGDTWISTAPSGDGSDGGGVVVVDLGSVAIAPLPPPSTATGTRRGPVPSLHTHPPPPRTHKPLPAPAQGGGGGGKRERVGTLDNMESVLAGESMAMDASFTMLSALHHAVTEGFRPTPSPAIRPLPSARMVAGATSGRTSLGASPGADNSGGGTLSPRLNPFRNVLTTLGGSRQSLSATGGTTALGTSSSVSPLSLMRTDPQPAADMAALTLPAPAPAPGFAPT